MKKTILVFVFFLSVSCSLEAQENWKKTLDAFFEINFESCYPRFRYIAIDEIEKPEILDNGVIIIKGKVVNGGNWGPVTRKFKAVISPSTNTYVRKRKIVVSKQVTGPDGRLIWKECEGEI